MNCAFCVERIKIHINFSEELQYYIKTKSFEKSFLSNTSHCEFYLSMKKRNPENQIPVSEIKTNKWCVSTPVFPGKEE